MDASLIGADASNNSVVDTHSLKRYLNKGYRELEKGLNENTTPENTQCRRYERTLQQRQMLCVNCTAFGTAFFP
jgi:hypothetical protein